MEQFTTILRQSINRSEKMCKAQIFLQNEAAYTCIAEMGELGLVQFIDLNKNVNAFQRKFVKEVRRCYEMERKLRFLEREIKKDGIKLLDSGENPDAPLLREMFDLEATFDKLENELREVNHNEEMLMKNFAELTELKLILHKAQQFFDENEEELAIEDVSSVDVSVLIPLLEPSEQAATKHLKFVAGVIQRKRWPSFERLLWRACRGNVFLRQLEITESLVDSATGLSVQKTVFIIFFQGDQLKSRVMKICEGFHAIIYPCPEVAHERREMLTGVMTQIEDLKTVIGQTQDHKHRVLVAASKNVRMWLTKVLKMKAIYYILNFFNVDVTQKYLIGECWCPVAEMEKIQFALRRGSEENESHVPAFLQRMDVSGEQPPTYNRVNKFTRVFQNLVDAYGIAAYREINPAPFTMITFPFLFAVMFGDLGHGVIMLLAAFYFIRNEKRLEAARISDEIFQMFFSGRYLIFLMGAFSIYTGFIYNDVFSKSFNLFGSSWSNTFSENELKEFIEPGVSNGYGEDALMLVPEKAFSQSGPYPMGVDPIWEVAGANKLNFLNSMKMKASVVLGISQMTLGVVLSYHNYKYQNSRLDMLYTFIPRMVFLASIFIYLCLQIVGKWVFFDAKGGYTILGYKYPGSHCAPSLLIGLINMFMMKDRDYGFVDEKGEELENCHLTYWYPGQSFFETLFIPIAVACVFVMLFAKPFLLWQDNKQRCQQLSGHTNLAVRVDMKRDGEVEVFHHNAGEQQKALEKRAENMHGNEKFDFGDIMVYQAIHTIEFALGCISHTASYLRLWALSLAHAQLSEVLWTMVFRQALAFDGYLGAVCTYVIFFVFASLTLAILVLMEGLSAFLHTLRLHWVEFQSKFYAGSGYPFLPFSFEIILEEARSAEESD